MQRKSYRIDMEQRTRECLAQLVEYYHKLGRIPTNAEIDKMARENCGHGSNAMVKCLGTKDYWLERLRREGYIDDEVKRTDRRKDDCPVTSGTMSRGGAMSVAAEAMWQAKAVPQERTSVQKKKTAKKKTTRQKVSGRQYYMTPDERRIAMEMKESWGKPKTPEEERVFRVIDARVELTSEERLWLKIEFLESKRNG